MGEVDGCLPWENEHTTIAEVAKEARTEIFQKYSAVSIFMSNRVRLEGDPGILT